MQVSANVGAGAYARAPQISRTAVVRHVRSEPSPAPAHTGSSPDPATNVQLSAEAQAYADHVAEAGPGHAPDTCESCMRSPSDQTSPNNASAAETNASDASAAKANASDAKANASDALTEDEQRQVAELAARDAEVRQHEQAHLAAAGPYANGGPTYDYQRGPDGKQYAVGGEVSIDTSEVPDDPEATVAKAQTIRRAALAPAEPSSQDRKVAAKATTMEAKARRELNTESTEQKHARQPDEKSAEHQPAEPVRTSRALSAYTAHSG